MIVIDWRLRYSERTYSALLSLYPVSFRLRFGPEMLQVFRAACRCEAVRGGNALLYFWLRTLKDLIASIPQEQGRELTRGLDANNPLVAFVDSLLIPTMIVMNLFVLGPLITALFAGAAAARIPADEFTTVSLIVSLVLGTLGILRALIVARLRPTVRLWVKLS
jgi:hypothetical protein